MKRSGLTKTVARRASAVPRAAAAERVPAKLAVLPARRARTPAHAHGANTSIGTLAGIGPEAEVYIDLPAEGRSAVLARSVVPLGIHLIGREVLVTQPAGDAAAPVVIGVLLAPKELSRAPALAAQNRTFTATIDGEHVALAAEKEITLRCGKASITLTADGKIVIKGAKLLSAASGLHRIRGGSVQIN